MTKQDLLFELGTEELPPKMLKTFSERLQQSVADQLQALKISYQSIIPFATPRRLALIVRDLPSESPAQVIERRGPAMSAALNKEGVPTNAALGFARSCGVEFDALQVIDTDKGQWLSFSTMQAGKPLSEWMVPILQKALQSLPIPKPMRWGNLDYEFARPVHWSVLLYGTEVIASQWYGQDADRKTYGHRFHHPAAITLSQVSEYESKLQEGYVIADFNKRQDAILKQLEALAKAQGALLIQDPELLQEVTAIVEWPQALLGQFDERFLKIPKEVLICSMRSHQKCFALQNQQGALRAEFITVANIESQDSSVVVLGNQRVIRARLTDAEFFYALDRKHKMEEWVASCQQVMYQEKLGSVLDKIERIKKISQYLAERLKAPAEIVSQAAQLAKADLRSAMVSEFPELQGIMGYYYALASSEQAAVAVAIREHYLPRFAQDALPETLPGAIVAIADRLDTLMGIFAIGEKPSGEKDPYGLRRSAIGIIRIIIEKQLSLDVYSCIEFAASLLPSTLVKPECVTEVHHFLLERLKQWYREQQIDQSLILAVLAVQSRDFLDSKRRLQAVMKFIKLPQAESLIAANKRVRNLFAKENLERESAVVQQNLMQHDAEKELFEKIQQQQQSLKPLLLHYQYSEALTTLASLQSSVDNLFNSVMILDENPAIRANRLALLAELYALFSEIADFSCITIA